MKTRIFVIASVVCICALIAMGQSKKRPSPSPTPASTWDSYEGVTWQKGNSVGVLGDIAQVKVPQGFVFAGANDTRLIMEANQNPTNGRELGLSLLKMKTGLPCLSLTTSATSKTTKKILSMQTRCSIRSNKVLKRVTKNASAAVGPR